MDAFFEAARLPGLGSAYPMGFLQGETQIPKEEGLVRFSWDESGLHVFAELEDSYLIAQNRKDEPLHFQSGDVFELFVKPLNEVYYWEMYAVPSGNKTTLFFPNDRTGMELDNFLHDHEFHGLEVFTEATSKGWNARMFVPSEQVTALGAHWGVGSEWTVLCGRYNYNSEDLTDPELTMAPALSTLNFHRTHEYARLRLIGAEQQEKTI